jgi:hypothetical protein
MGLRTAFLLREEEGEGQSKSHPHLNPLQSETVSQCHPEAVAEGSPICKGVQSLDSSPAAQNDIRVIFVLRHSLSRERRGREYQASAVAS